MSKEKSSQQPAGSIDSSQPPERNDDEVNSPDEGQEVVDSPDETPEFTFDGPHPWGPHIQIGKWHFTNDAAIIIHDGKEAMRVNKQGLWLDGSRIRASGPWSFNPYEAMYKAFLAGFGMDMGEDKEEDKRSEQEEVGKAEIGGE